MKHELKVIIGTSTGDTVVYVDDQPIGLIQDIKIHASVEDTIPVVEIVFPNLLPFRETNRQTVEQLEAQLDMLKEIPNVKITVRDIEFNKQ